MAEQVDWPNPSIKGKLKELDKVEKYNLKASENYQHSEKLQGKELGKRKAQRGEPWGQFELRCLLILKA